MITFEDFQKLDIRIGKIVKVEEVGGADKLLRLVLDLRDLGERTVVAGIKEYYRGEELEGKLILYLANMEPKTIHGVESQGMLLAADDGRPYLIFADSKVSPGSRVR